MLKISPEYSVSIARPQRRTKISGQLSIKNDETIVTLTDEDIVQGSLKIVDQLGNGSFGVGGVYVRNLSVKLKGFMRFNEVSLINSKISFKMFLYYDNYPDKPDDGEWVELGEYIVDPSKSKKVGDTLSITAQDYLSKLDVPIEDWFDENQEYSLYDFVSTAVNNCAYTYFAMSREEFEALPNGTLKIKPNLSRIKTARDAVMFAGAITATFARNEIGNPANGIKLVKIGANADDPSMPVLANIIRPNVRYSGEFAENSVRVMQTTMNVNGETRQSTRWIPSGTVDKWYYAIMEMSENPFLSDKSEAEIEQALTNINNAVHDLDHFTFSLSFNGNPAMQVGDRIQAQYYAERDANGDESETVIRLCFSYITYSCWRYRGKCDLKCKSFSTLMSKSTYNTEGYSAIAALNARGIDPRAADLNQVQPKPQIEKRIDALEKKVAQGGGGESAWLKVKMTPNGAEFYDFNDKFVGAVYGFVPGNDLQIFTPSYGVNISRNGISVMSSTNNNNSYDKLMLQINAGGITYFGNRITPETN